MKKFLLGMLIMSMALKPSFGIAIFSIFAEGMQTAAAAMAERSPKVSLDPSTSFVPPNTVYSTLDPKEEVVETTTTKKDRARVDQFEERVMAIIEKRREHELEQQENQRKIAEAEATAKAEKAGVELFDEEFNKKFPTKR